MAYSELSGCSSLDTCLNGKDSTRFARGKVPTLSVAGGTATNGGPRHGSRSKFMSFFGEDLLVPATVLLGAVRAHNRVEVVLGATALGKILGFDARPHLVDCEN